MNRSFYSVVAVMAVAPFLMAPSCQTNASVKITSPAESEYVCNEDVAVRAIVETNSDISADVLLVEYLPDSDGTVWVLGAEYLQGGEDGTFAYEWPIPWSYLEDYSDETITFAVDVGDFTLVPGQSMSRSSYDATVDATDIWARATRSIVVCD